MKRRRRISKRRMILVPFTGVAWVLVVASVAWACVTFQGRFQVRTNNGTSTAFGSGYHPDSAQYPDGEPGGQSNVEYCRPPVGKATADDQSNTTVTVTQAAYGGCQWVNPANTESGTDGGPVSDGLYDVRLDTRNVFCDLAETDCPPAGLEVPEDWKQDQAGWFRLNQPNPADLEQRGTQCYYRPGDVQEVSEIKHLGTMRVVNGRGKATLPIPAGDLKDTGPSDTAGICTREQGDPRILGRPPHSNQAPVIVI
ncbi:MAG: hypothetical protein M3O70_03230 [Actinomycetota bacterium]|nr:hypothetical protein [Actinomycetota bacterium]